MRHRRMHRVNSDSKRPTREERGGEHREMACERCWISRWTSRILSQAFCTADGGVKLIKMETVVCGCNWYSSRGTTSWLAIPALPQCVLNIPPTSLTADVAGRPERPSQLPAWFPLLTSGPSITAGSVMVDMTSLINSTGISPDTRDLLASSRAWELFIFLFSPVMFKIKGKKKTDGLKWKIWPDESNLFEGGNLGVRQTHVSLPGLILTIYSSDGLQTCGNPPERWDNRYTPSHWSPTWFSNSTDGCSQPSRRRKTGGGRERRSVLLPVSDPL